MVATTTPRANTVQPIATHHRLSVANAVITTAINTMTLSIKMVAPNTVSPARRLAHSGSSSDWADSCGLYGRGDWLTDPKLVPRQVTFAFSPRRDASSVDFSERNLDVTESNGDLFAS